MKTNKELEEELRKMANKYWSLHQEVKVFLDAAEIIHDYDRVKQSESVYKKEAIEAVEACAWMHDDKTLGLTLGARLTSEGVTALRNQRDELRAVVGMLITSMQYIHDDTDGSSPSHIGQSRAFCTARAALATVAKFNEAKK
jgi:hypothetical protein